MSGHRRAARCKRHSGRPPGSALGLIERYPLIDAQLGTKIMSERFTETLHAASEPGWSHAVGHRFVKELFAGAVPDAVMARYLIQDHRFLDSFLTLLGAALASADTFAAKLRFGRFIGVVSSEENTYFLRAFEALGVTENRRTADPDSQATAGFKAIMREAAQTRHYAAALSVLVVTEWLYLDWASRAPKPLPDNFVHAEWIGLHDSPDFRDFVDFLRAELDRVGPAGADLCRDFFRRAAALELAFFDAAYAERT
jgi:thiaminase/transcriptional activator TenA